MTRRRRSSGASRLAARATTVVHESACPLHWLTTLPLLLLLASCAGSGFDCTGSVCTGGTSSTGGTAETTGGNAGSGGARTTEVGSAGTSSGDSSGGTSMGGVSATGGAATGGAPTCSPACSGVKPVCDVARLSCVECLNNGNCAAPTPACNPATNTCVGCMLDSYCSAPTPACNMATYACVQCTQDANCTAPTPACNSATNTCVACTKDAHCPAATPLCDPTKNTCVQCLDNNDCPSASASLCLAGTCSPCATNNDCSHITGKTVCKSDSDPGADAGAGSGTCVECTGTDYAACSDGDAGLGYVCDSLKNTCSTKAEHSAGLCQTCVSDAQCAPGELCAEQVFNGKSVGYFCFYKQGDTANGAPADCFASGRPYVKALKSTSIDGQSAELCALAVSACPALNEFRSKSCDSGTGAPSDQLCGTAPGVDSKCALVGTTQYRCTVTCLSDDDCRSGVACNTAVNPPVCNLQ